jgi:tetratricopeptide (TPR) repeat protein
MLQFKNKMNERLQELIQEFLCVTDKATVGFIEVTEVLLLAKHFQKNQNLEDAITVINVGIKKFPSAAELYAYKATLLTEQGNDPEIVVTYLDKALDFSPNDPNILLFKAEVFSSQEQFDEAQNILDFLTFYADETVMEQVGMLQAYIADQQEDFDMMFDALAKVLKINPNNQEALMQMWLATLYAERYDESVIIHEAVLDEDPYSFQAWQNLGHAHFGLRNLDEAIFAYEYATITQPDYELAYLDLALCCVEAGKFEEALGIYHETEQRFGTTAELSTKIGHCYQLLQKYIEASAQYSTALQNDEKNDEAYYRMGECLMLQNDYKRAIEAFSKAIAIRPQLEEYYLALARAYEAAGNNDLALQAYDRLIEVAPECPEHWIHQADFYCTLQLYADALETLDIAEMNISRNAYLLYHKAVCYFRMGERSHALTFLQEALLEDYALHNRIFQALPHLEKDYDVMNLIKIFR